MNAPLFNPIHIIASVKTSRKEPSHWRGASYAFLSTQNPPVHLSFWLALRHLNGDLMDPILDKLSVLVKILTYVVEVA